MADSLDGLVGEAGCLAHAAADVGGALAELLRGGGELAGIVGGAGRERVEGAGPLANGGERPGGRGRAVMHVVGGGRDLGNELHQVGFDQTDRIADLLDLAPEADDLRIARISLGRLRSGGGRSLALG